MEKYKEKYNEQLNNPVIDEESKKELRNQFVYQFKRIKEQMS